MTLEEQLVKWPTCKSDDRLDALAYAGTSLFTSTGRLIPKVDPDYEAAKDLIREVVSAQEETPSP